MPLKTPERKAADEAAMLAKLTAPPIDAAENGIRIPALADDPIAKAFGTSAAHEELTRAN